MQGRGNVAVGHGAVFEGKGFGLAPRTDAAPMRFDNDRAEQVGADDDRVAPTNIARGVYRREFDRVGKVFRSAIHGANLTISALDCPMTNLNQ